MPTFNPDENRICKNCGAAEHKHTWRCLDCKQALSVDEKGFPIFRKHGHKIGADLCCNGCTPHQRQRIAATISKWLEQDQVLPEELLNIIGGVLLLHIQLTRHIAPEIAANRIEKLLLCGSALKPHVFCSKCGRRLGLVCKTHGWQARCKRCTDCLRCLQKDNELGGTFRQAALNEPPRPRFISEEGIYYCTMPEVFRYGGLRSKWTAEFKAIDGPMKGDLAIISSLEEAFFPIYALRDQGCENLWLRVTTIQRGKRTYFQFSWTAEKPVVEG